MLLDRQTPLRAARQAADTQPQPNRADAQLGSVEVASGLDPATCLARDDQAFSRFLEPGTYYVAADTYVDSGGTEGPQTIAAVALADGHRRVLAHGDVAFPSWNR